MYSSALLHLLLMIRGSLLVVVGTAVSFVASGNEKRQLLLLHDCRQPAGRRHCRCNDIGIGCRMQPPQAQGPLILLGVAVVAALRKKSRCRRCRKQVVTEEKPGGGAADSRGG